MKKVDALFDDRDRERTQSVAGFLGAPRENLREPLSPGLSGVLREVQKECGFQQGDVIDKKLLEQSIIAAGLRLGFELSASERDLIFAHLEDERMPFGLLQGLVDDPSISDIIVTDYAKISVQQGRRNITTSLSFPSKEAYEAFVERLLLSAGASCSTKKPIADGMIGGFARIHVVHQSLCETGPYLTVRLNRFGSVRLADLERSGLAPALVLQYLRALVQSGITIMVVGEVGTGKTTLVRALAASIPQDQSILVIEDTPEIKLEHSQVRYIRTREQNTDGAGEVTPAECIRGGMRMAMNRIVFGEIRDAQAAEAFVDVCASGHSGLSTIHARSAQEAMTRLELFLGRAQRGVERLVLSEQIITAVQVIVHVDICRKSWRRRIIEVREIGPVADGVIRQREMFRYEVHNEIPTWRLINRGTVHREQLESQGVLPLLHESATSLELEPEVILAQSRRAA